MPSSIDLSQPEQLLRAFVKTRASLIEEEVVCWWSGRVYSLVPGEPSRFLFAIEGYNICRCRSIPGGYEQLSREMMVYQDPKQRSILERWVNPFTGEEVEVVPVWNDPVNQRYLLEGPQGPFTLQVTPLEGGRLCLALDVLLAYPSPLPRALYPRYSQSDLYQGAELFQFFVSQDDLENATLSSVPCEIAWTRIGPWLPWMAMADRPGWLLYQCRGCKLQGGYAALPAALRSYVERHQPHYQHAPLEWSGPNESSWSYFKKKLLASQVSHL
uniref:DUF1838 domain-containing protein n=1 Tax=Thermogemmatispora argillosa TaxID=2045280 RepID=A0A455SX13_9CHLR|nr:hypothetical protein KTA_04190 [Thermogemmatispora argillosa]